MFFREKRSKGRSYLQIVENQRDRGRSRQRVVVSLGLLAAALERREVDSLLESGGRFARQCVVVSSRRGSEPARARTRSVGTELLFAGLWNDLGWRRGLTSAAGAGIERALFRQVLCDLVRSAGLEPARAEVEETAAEDAPRSVVRPAAGSPADPVSWLSDPVGGHDDGEDRFRKDDLEERLFGGSAPRGASGGRLFVTRLAPELGEASPVGAFVFDLGGRPLASASWPSVPEPTAIDAFLSRLRSRRALSGIDRVSAPGGQAGWETLLRIRSHARALGTTWDLAAHAPRVAAGLCRAAAFRLLLGVGLRNETTARVAAAGTPLDWERAFAELSRLHEIELEQHGTRLLLLEEPEPAVAALFEAVGVPLPKPVRDA